MRNTSLNGLSATVTRFTLDACEPDFPTALGQTHPAVRRLYGKGDKSRVQALARSPGLAIVGSRQASPQGVANARWFAKEASRAGLTIVSGLAQGIDASAHQGALEAQGVTIAVLGHGCDSIYPAQHQGLASEIVASQGALVSEYPDGVPALPHHFPNRNRIIAALARAILVVEAAPQSGSLITARHALELGIDVYVIPGSIHQTQHLGSNHLIREGAQLTQSPEQLLTDLGLLPPERCPMGSRASSDRRSRSSPKSTPNPAGQKSLMPDLDSRAQQVLDNLTFQPAAIWELQQACGGSPGDLYGSLLVLELCGLASRLPDGRWLKYKA